MYALSLWEKKFHVTRNFFINVRKSCNAVEVLTQEEDGELDGYVETQN